MHTDDGRSRPHPGGPTVERPLSRASRRASGLTTDEIALLRAFFGLSTEDERNLDRIRFAVRENLDGLLDLVYEQPFPRARSARPAIAKRTMDTLRQAQRSCLTTLGLDSHTEEYVAGRLRVGLLHESAGLDRAWYVGAYARLFQPIALVLARHHTSATSLATVLSTLQRILAFDSHLLVQAYFDADLGRLDEELQRATDTQRTIVAASRRDSVTQIDSRAFLLEALQQEVERSRRPGEEFSLLFIDVDHFKAINDAYGHATGDEMLRRVVDVVRRSLRPADIVGRYGGDEFLVGLVHTGAATALRIGGRVCESVSADREGRARVTVSIGCATLAANENVDALIRRADLAMYSAKAGGRNACAISRPGALS